MNVFPPVRRTISESVTENFIVDFWMLDIFVTLPDFIIANFTK